MNNDTCPCGSGKKYRQCCWLRRFESAAPPPAPPPPAPAPPDGLYDPCPCGGGKVYRRCCHPRTFPDPTQPNLGFEPHLDRAAAERAHKRRAAQPVEYASAIADVTVGRTLVMSAPMSSVGDTLPGTLAPPTPRQVEAKYDWIREGNPDGVTEVVVTYTYPDMFGLAEARMVFDADERFRLADGRTVSVLDLHRGMRVVMADGSVGTIVGHPERRYGMPLPPLPAGDELWTSRVIGRVKHTAHEVVEFRWAGQVVRVTPGHEVWSADRRGWVGAHELHRGELIRVYDNVVAPVEAIRRVPGFVEVYGIDVEYFHNYFVGTGPDAMLVHNGPVCVVKPRQPGLFDDVPDTVPAGSVAPRTPDTPRGAGVTGGPGRPGGPGLFDHTPHPEGPLAEGVRSLRGNQYNSDAIAIGQSVHDAAEIRDAVGEALQATGRHTDALSGLYSFIRRNGGAGFQGVTRNPLDRPSIVIRNFGESTGDVIAAVHIPRIEPARVYDLRSPAVQGAFLARYPTFGRELNRLAGEGVAAIRGDIPVEAVTGLARIPKNADPAAIRAALLALVGGG